jgi:cytochrome c peroxidase
MRLSAVGLVACVLLLTTVGHAGDVEPVSRGTDRPLRSQPLPPDFPEPARDADFYDNGAPDPAKVELGRLLFYDKILSGNLNTSCATCHHSLTATGDGLSLPVGEGGVGLGMTRMVGHGRHKIEERVPRNAPPVFNLGAREFERMFFDGRVEVLSHYPLAYRSPAGASLPFGLDNVLAVQAMFPVTSPAEMAGQAGENPQADFAAADDLPGLWEHIAAKLRSIPAYVDLFIAVFGDDPVNPVAVAQDISYVHAANAIAAFEAVAWRADNSPFDQYLRGDFGALNARQQRGMLLFYGDAGCSGCHSGTFQTDHGFHSIGLPQIGPGKGDGPDGHDDYGREQVTLDAEDRFTFRTPTLRNVELTGPWGHDGAYNTLRGMVSHHLDPQLSSAGYDLDEAVLPPDDELAQIDFVVHSDPVRRSAIEASCEIQPKSLEPFDLDCLLEFLMALTDRSSIDLRRDVPYEVPSGLPVYD